MAVIERWENGVLVDTTVTDDDPEPVEPLAALTAQVAAQQATIDALLDALGGTP